jgi:tetratricopeptide (TPR) repeat protein
LKSDVEIAEALEKVGHAYAANEKFDEALNYYLSALQQREKQGQRSKYSLQVARTLNYIGDTHRSLHQFEQALACYKRAITIYKHFPLETNRDRLRTLDKINKITQEIPSKTDVIVATKILRNRTTTSSLRSLKTKNNKNNVKSHENLLMSRNFPVSPIFKRFRNT